MNFNLISTAMAATNTPMQPAGGGIMSSVLLILAFIAIFYFLLIRPQARRAKEHSNLLTGLQIGDEIMTNGGIVGKITKMKDDFVVLAVTEQVEIKIQKSAIVNTLPKGTIKSIG